jgi:vacuolar-type H+-ATPase subunit H
MLQDTMKSVKKAEKDALKVVDAAKEKAAAIVEEAKAKAAACKEDAKAKTTQAYEQAVSQAHSESTAKGEESAAKFAQEIALQKQQAREKEQAVIEAVLKAV